MRRAHTLLSLALALSACSNAAQSDGQSRPVPSDEESAAHRATVDVMTRVAHYEVSQLGSAPGNDWVNSVFYVGLLASHSVTHDSAALDALESWATQNAWALHSSRKGPRFADDQCCTQAYLDFRLLGDAPPNEAAVQAARSAFDAMIAKPVPGRQEWYWCDALFMAPGALARLGAVTGDAKYFDFLHVMFWDAEANLRSPSTGLFWRDQNFFQSNVYWSRGNAWVLAGTVRVLQYLPRSDPKREAYVELLRSLSATVVPVQGADGLWRSDLLDPNAFPNPETSGSALFTFALAWGVSEGALDRATYLPVVQRAWAALVASVDADGRLGWVQPSGVRPAAALPSDSFPYGVGAFLLAGSEMAKLE